MRIPYKTLLLGPTALMALGYLLNVVVIAANHSQMPVEWPGGCSSYPDDGDLIHTCMTHASHLKFLADWIVIKGFGVASPGDFMEWAYDATVVPCLAIWAVLMIQDHK